LFGKLHFLSKARVADWMSVPVVSSWATSFFGLVLQKAENGIRQFQWGFLVIKIKNRNTTLSDIPIFALSIGWRSVGIIY
jgi:hypothetical protein